MSLSITFGDQAENHVGMQAFGDKAEDGYSYEKLYKIYQKIKKEHPDYELEFIKLHRNLPEELRTDDHKAAVLVIRKGVKLFGVKPKSLRKEHMALEPDKKALMWGSVKNKHARWNLCYGDKAQKQEIEEGKGTIVAFKKVPLLNQIRERLPDFFGSRAKGLVAELNVYYDVSKCGIGYHGDGERKIVICIRLGEDNPLVYQWYHRGAKVGERIDLDLSEGDIYVMSEKAVGFDWKKSSLYTLRHAAGSEKYIK